MRRKREWAGSSNGKISPSLPSPLARFLGFTGSFEIEMSCIWSASCFYREFVNINTGKRSSFNSRVNNPAGGVGGENTRWVRVEKKKSPERPLLPARFIFRSNFSCPEQWHANGCGERRASFIRSVRVSLDRRDIKNSIACSLLQL